MIQSAPISPHLVAVAWLLTYLLHSTVVLGGVWVLTRNGPLSSPRHRAFFWKTGVIAGLLTASVQVTLVSWPTGSASGPKAIGRYASGPAYLTWTARVDGPDGQPTAIRQAGRVPADSPACRQALTRNLHEARERLAEGVATSTVPFEVDVDALVDRCGGRRAGTWPWVLLAAWVAGSLFGGGVLLRRSHRLRRALDPSWTSGGDAPALLGQMREKAGIRSPVWLFEAPGLATPVALTGRRIVLPSFAAHRMEDDELTAVLAHEMGHLASRDPRWLQVLCMLEALLWIQPLNRLARRGSQDASEFLADAWAVRRTGSGLPLARSLEKISRWSRDGERPGAVLAMARPESPLVERVRAILDTPRADSARGASRWSALILVPAILLPPVRVPGPPAVRVLVVRELRAPSATNLPLGDAPITDERIEIEVEQSWGPPPS